MNSSPFLLVKQLQADVLRLLSGIDVTTLDTKEQQVVEDLRNNLIDVRIEIQNYELAETREHQLKNAKVAKKHMQTIEKLIMSNPVGVFGPVDVAHLTAYIGQITDRLK